MTVGPDSNPLPRLSDGDERELLALIEGELTPDQERAILTRWQGRPEVLRAIEGMVADRAALCSLPEVVAPAGLLNGVESFLEREALVGEADADGSEFSTGTEHGTLISSTPPRLTISVRGNPMSMLFSRYGALAAVLAIAIGGSAYLMMPSRPAVGPSSGAGDVTSLADRGANPATDGQLAKSEPATELLGPAADSSSNDRIAAATPSDAAESAVRSKEMASALESGQPLAVETEITAERAVELAREGRFMIRVVAANPERAIRRAEATMRDRNGSAGNIGSVDAAPADAVKIAAAAEAIRPLEGRIGFKEFTDKRRMAVGSEEGKADVPGVPRPANISLQLKPVPPRAAAAIDIRLSAEAIDSLRAMLASRGQGVVEFVELPAAIPVEQSFDPESAIWWMQPPSAWVPRMRVPVVFEQP